MPTQQQLLIVYHIVGAISTNIIRSKYDQMHEDQKCTFCDERDTVEHRIFSCSVTQKLREATSAMSCFEAFDKSMLHCPVMPRHSDEGFHEAVCFMREIDLAPVSRDDHLLIYTDASMDAGDTGFTNCAFAVVVLTGATTDQRREWAQKYREQGQLPPFELAYSAKTPGVQTTNRGELCAVVKAVSMSNSVEVVTDSSYAKDLLELALQQPNPALFTFHDNMDLVMILLRLLNSATGRNVMIRKVASHRAVDLQASDQDLLDRLGNDYVDTAANMQRTQDSMGFLAMHDGIRDFRLTWMKRLREFYTFIAAMAVAFQTAWKQVRTDKPAEEAGRDFAQLQDRVHGPFHDFSSVELTADMRSMAYFTTQFTEALLMWAKQLRWPIAVMPGPGVTYIELLLSFLRTTGMTIPVNMASEYSQTRNYQLRHQSKEAAAQPRSRSQDLRVFSFAMEYLVKLTGVDFFPVKHKGLVSSLSFIGLPKARTGYTVRCRYPYENEVLAHVASSLTTDKVHWSLNSVPDVPGAPTAVIPPRPDDHTVSTTSRFCRFQYRQKCNKRNSHS
eukprot:Skav201316  [mRNA]  locus=scaffold4158:7362:9038:- [translate_table: standard]